MANTPIPWYRNGPRPGQRILAVMLVYGVFGLICLVGVFAGAVYFAGSKLGLWKGPPEPTPANVAADLSSDRLSQQSRGLRNLKKLTPDSEEREVALALIGLLKSKFSYKQDEAIKALGDWGQPEDADVLAVYVNNTHWGRAADRRRAAITSLGKLGGPRAAELLASNLIHKADREAVIAALKQIGSVGEPAVLAVLEDDETATDVRIAAIEVLIGIGTKRSLEALKRLETDGDSKVTEASLLARDAIEARMK